MYGAILGDIIGSSYEFDRGDKTKDFELFSRCQGSVPPAVSHNPQEKAAPADDPASPKAPGQDAPKNKIAYFLGDITTLPLDAIVNAANQTLLGGGGVDGAIHRAAGKRLLEECRTLHGCQTGEAKITKGYLLPARYVIHTVGPIYSGAKDDAILLRRCYYQSLELAKQHHLHSIGFPAISTGAYGYPKQEAAHIALHAILDWFQDNPHYGMAVTIVNFSADDYAVYQQVMKELYRE